MFGTSIATSIAKIGIRIADRESTFRKFGVTFAAGWCLGKCSIWE
jgi:hypothetical protein